LNDWCFASYKYDTQHAVLKARRLCERVMLSPDIQKQFQAAVESTRDDLKLRRLFAGLQNASTPELQKQYMDCIPSAWYQLMIDYERRFQGLTDEQLITKYPDKDLPLGIPCIKAFYRVAAKNPAISQFLNIPYPNLLSLRFPFERENFVLLLSQSPVFDGGKAKADYYNHISKKTDISICEALITLEELERPKSDWRSNIYPPHFEMKYWEM